MHGSGGSSEDQDADRDLAFKPCVLVTSWRIQLPSACVLQFRVQLNNLFFDKMFFVQREFHDSIASRMCHGSYSLPLARFAVKFEINKQNRKM